MTVHPSQASGSKPAQFKVSPELPLEYINLVRIAHSPMDLVFDFARVLPGAITEVRSRVVMSPLGAKLLLKALAENLAKYEAVYGEIHVPGDTSLADYLFKTPDKESGQPDNG